MPSHTLARLTAGAVAVAAMLGVATRPAAQSPGSALDAATVDVVALDAGGNAVSDLGATDLRVTVDGEPRAVRAVRYVFRGPAAEAAVRSSRLADGVTATSAPVRTALFAVDENTVAQGGERFVAPVLYRAVDVFSRDDQLAVIALPEPHGRALLSANRETLTEAVNHLAGREPAAAAERAAADPRRGEAPTEFGDEEDTARAEVGGTRTQTASERVAPPKDDATARAQPAAGESPETADSLSALARVVSDLRGIATQKAVIYVSAGSPVSGPPAPVRRQRVAEVIEAAARSGVAIHVVAVPRGGTGRPQPEMERLALATGGTFTKVAGSGGDFARLRGAFSGTYQLEIEARPEDATRTRALVVTTTRPRITLLAAQQWIARTPAPATTATEARRTPSARPAPAPAAEDPAAAATAAQATTGDAALRPILEKVTAYVDGYLRDFSTIVMEEDYLQRVVVQGYQPRTQRTRSDLLLIATSDATGWAPFRDVFEVAGRKVRDREDRLRKLFLERPDTALAEGRRITDEGARYNIGSVYRTLNVPTLALALFTSHHLSKIHVDQYKRDSIGGAAAWRIDFTETGTPALVQQKDTGKDLPSTGTIWALADTGRIVKTTLRTGDGSFRMETTVEYQPDQALALWTPSWMNETYRARMGTETITGQASYSNFRRFRVSTDEKTAMPK